MREEAGDDFGMDYPKASSSADSSGVPQTRQMRAEQSPQTRGSETERAQTGHQKTGGAGGVDGGTGGEDMLGRG